MLEQMDLLGHTATQNTSTGRSAMLTRLSLQKIFLQRYRPRNTKCLNSVIFWCEVKAKTSEEIFPLTFSRNEWC